MNTNKENFLKLVSKEKNDTMDRINHRIKYRWFYNIKNNIILKWLVFKDSIKTYLFKKQ